MKFEIVVNGMSTIMVCYCEDEKELRDTIATAKWIEVDTPLGNPIVVNSEYIVALWEADEEDEVAEVVFEN